MPLATTPMLRTGLRHLIVSRILPLALMWLAIGLSGYLGDVLEDRARLT